MIKFTKKLINYKLSIIKKDSRSNEDILMIALVDPSSKLKFYKMKSFIEAFILYKYNKLT